MDLSGGFIAAAKEAFASVEGITFWTGNVRDFQPGDHPVAAFVSPANSIGFMDGGIDAAYMMMFPGIQRTVKHVISVLGMETGLGRPYLPVGSAIVIETIWEDGPDTALISAPTMFLPHSVVGTRNAYYAFMAALCLFERAGLGEGGGRMVCPALCTGYGQMPVEESAKQMYEALRDFVEGKRPEQNKKYADIPWCFVGPNVDHEQPRNFDNREIQEVWCKHKVGVNT